VSETQAPARAGGAIRSAGPSLPAPGLRLVRLPVERPQPAVAFLRLRSRGVMDLIAHFWEGLAQTAPLQRGDLHLVAAAPNTYNVDVNTNICEPGAFCGAMLYVPKAHRADVLALDQATAAAFASYICRQGGVAPPEAVGPHVSPYSVSTCDANAAVPPGVEMGEPATVTVTDLSTTPRHGVPEQTVIPAEPPACQGTPGNGGGVEANGANGINGGTSAGGAGAGSAGGGTAGAVGSAPNGATGGTGGTGGGRVAIDFLTGAAEGIAWMTPLLLPLVRKRTPERQLINVVMQLPAEAVCGPNVHVRLARESDIPLLNRWRRLYKEERGIHFDADMDAMVQSQRVFVFELRDAVPGDSAASGAAYGGTGMAGGGGDGRVVSVAKFDLELAALVEIGGVYTFSEYRHRGYGAALVGDLAHRIRQAGKVPTLQVDDQNVPALRLYEKAGWTAMGKLARVWLTG
jgi:ribosomal protein S18 acetylase RimI-like enzyme